MKPGTDLLPLNYRMCSCGCGQTPPISKMTCRSKGRFKGYPTVQVPGHQGRWKRPEPTGNPNPDGYCQCNCGQKTTIARQSDTKHDQVRGKHKRFIIGHQLRIEPYRSRATAGIRSRWQAKR